MKNILLICSAGISSGLIVKKMQDATAHIDSNINVWSSGVANASEEVQKADIVLLSPPAAYLKETFDDLVNENTVVKVVDTDLYSSTDGKKIIEFALAE